MIDERDILDAARAFAALGSEQRLAVLGALVRAGEAGLTVGELRDKVGLAPSTLTHHLKTLAEAELVVQERQGREIRCAGADYDRVRRLSEFLLRACCADAAQDARHSHHARKGDAS